MLYYLAKQEHKKIIEITSIEKDKSLFNKLQNFCYPKELIPFLPILQKLLQTQSYQDSQTRIKILNQDAAVLNLENNYFNIIFLDPFSMSVNGELWSDEFLLKLFNAMQENAILTTYSNSKVVKNRLKTCGFIVKEKQSPLHRTSVFCIKPSQKPKGKT